SACSSHWRPAAGSVSAAGAHRPCRGPGWSRSYGPCPSPLDGLQAQETLHRLEIAIRMQQHVPALNAECADDQVSELPHRDPARPQKPVVGCRDEGEVVIVKRNDLEAAKSPLDPAGFRLRVEPAENFTK